MTKQALLYLMIAAAMSTAGNLLIKLSSVQHGDADFPLNYMNWPFILGCLMYGCNLLLFLKALSTSPVSAAYPILAGTGFAFLAISSFFVFNERLSITAVSGIGLIIGGIVLIAGQNPGSGS